ncbi:hypothetical protein U27_03748 [Candidatus Vecturithrix granuli]|uniref:Uncharacterized protein n=1 Tax=Vecturithrix granuli TaxID=1499967 RepID=A0A081BWS9_VECG1|nr:hypothetical protein U27_03748 [Candidatus Vecturithrix granuli]
MHGWKIHGRKSVGIGIAGIILAAILIFIVFKETPRTPESNEPHVQTALEAARKEGYDVGYANGYNAAREESSTVYQKGYEAARQEIGRQAFTRSGVFGFLVGLLISTGMVVAIKRKEFSASWQTFKKQYALRKTFQKIPPNLSPEIEAVAQQIARSYITILAQLRKGQGYVVSPYAKQWRTKLQMLMHKALRLMELIQELEAARDSIDQKQLTRTIRNLQHIVQNADQDDDTRNAAVKALQRAKQTHRDLLKTYKNLENCKASLQGITGVLDSMHLKISNLNVNTQKTELLEELSSDLEQEMFALEEALQEFAV